MELIPVACLVAELPGYEKVGERLLAMGKTIYVGNRIVGAGQPVYVIAEVGCNHENDFDRAREMVIKVAEAGVDAVKFQTFDPDTLVTRDAPKFWDIPGPGETQYEELVDAKPSFTVEQYRELLVLAERQGIVFFSTPTDETLVDFLDDLGVPAFKIASMDITHLPLLRHVARKGKPIILSTGTAYIEEVREAVGAIVAESNEEIMLLHCISSYPTEPDGANLRMMHHLAQEFPKCVIGYSDHTLPTFPLAVPTLAVAAGAKVVEKHVTFDRTRPGYDHQISADYVELKRMIAEFRFVERVLGKETKAPTEAEDRARRLGRRSLVAVVDIPRGAVIRSEMLAAKRPGIGIEPKFLDRVVGRVARRDIHEDEILTPELIQGD